MARKDFILIADSLIKSRPDKSNAIAYDQWQNTLGCIMATLELSNPSFNRTKFREYCSK